MAKQDQQQRFAGAMVKLGAGVYEGDPEEQHILQMIATQNISDDQIDDCISFITLLHHSDVDFNVRCPNGDSFFQLAARHGNWKILEKLVVDVTQDINDVDTKDNEGLTVLHRLASSESAHHVKLVQFLFEKGSRCDILNSTGDSVMHMAAENNNWYIIETFLRSETKPYSSPTTAETDCQIGKHRLHTTDTDGAGRAHFNIDVKDHSGNTILHLSAKKGKWDLVYKLLMFGSDATLADGEGHTVMYWLAAEDHATFTNDSQRKKVLQWLKMLKIIAGVATDEKDALGDTMIQVAARNKNVDVMNILLDAVDDANMVDSSGLTILHRAVQWNPWVSLHIVKTLIDKEVDIECRCPDGNTALHLAAKSSNWTVVQMLLENGADASSADNQGRSVLHRFVASIQIKDSSCEFSDNCMLFNSEEKPLALVRLMISRGASISSKDPDDLTPLRIASFQRKWSVVALFLQCEAKVSENMIYILHELALDTHVDADLARTITTQLLRRGLNINERIGVTPLNLAVEHKNLTVVRVFIEHGADESTVKSKEWYWSHASSTHYSLHRFRKSVQMKRSCKFSDNRLLLNSEKGSLDLVTLMVSSGANINSEDPNGLTSLRLAIMQRKWSIVEFLLQREAKVPENTTNILHELAKDTAIDADLATTITTQLLSRGLDINEMTDDTPLNLAAEHQNWTVVRVFLEHGADASIRDSEGWFVCHRLVMDRNQSNCSEVNQFILLMTKNGFQINQASRTGQSALQIALEREEWKIFWCLVQFGASCSLRFQNKINILKNVFQCPRQMINPDTFTQFMLHVTNKDSFSRSKQNKIEMSKRKALTKCMSQYNWPVATVLVQCGVDIRSSVEGRPLLHYVVSKYQRQDHEMWLSLLDALLARGVDINCQDRQGRTVLFDHSVYCSAECSQDDFNLLFHGLIDRGANPLHTDRAGISLFGYYLNIKEGFGLVLLKLLVQTGELTIQAKLTRPAERRAATRSSCQRANECSPIKTAFDTKKVLAFKLLAESGASSNRELFELANQTESTLNRNTRREGQMLEVLCQAVHQPRTLKSLCRLTVLHAVGYGPQRIHRLMTLPVPSLLKKYLLFSDITLKKSGSGSLKREQF